MFWAAALISAALAETSAVILAEPPMLKSAADLAISSILLATGSKPNMILPNLTGSKTAAQAVYMDSAPVTAIDTNGASLSPTAISHLMADSPKSMKAIAAVLRACTIIWAKAGNPS